MEGERDAKIGSICRAIKNYSAEAKAYKTEREKLAARERSAASTVEHLKGYLKAYLSRGEKYKDSTVSLYWTSRSSVEVLCDAEDLPEEYTAVEIRAAKSEIAEGLKKNDEKLEGKARLVQNHSIVVR